MSNLTGGGIKGTAMLYSLHTWQCSVVKIRHKQADSACRFQYILTKLAFSTVQISFYIVVKLNFLLTFYMKLDKLY